MLRRTFYLCAASALMIAAWSLLPAVHGQEPAEQPAAELPPVPQGVEVLARGPVHEAFATPNTEPAPTKPISKQPPAPVEELPPEEKPEGNVSWISGYWALDDESGKFMWVSGIWRSAPPGKRWVPGYWRESGAEWQWVPGFWTAAKEEAKTQEITYLPAPPAAPQTAAPGEAPNNESFYVPGNWVWQSDRYIWKPGYWAKVQPNYVWVTAHYSWSPSGYVFVPGYWDLTVANRGVLYAPVIIDPVVVGPRFVYTPAYVVHDTIVVDTLWVRPAYRHYYFGDYYGPVYRGYGFESAVVYSSRHYDAVFVYARYEHRHEPSWYGVRLNLYHDRDAGRVARPPRTLVQQNVIVQNNITVNKTVNKTIVNNNQVLAPASQLAKAKGVKTEKLDAEARKQARQQANEVQQVAAERKKEEIPVPKDRQIQPRTAKLNVPPTAPVKPAKAAQETGAAATRPPNTGERTKPAEAAKTASPGAARDKDTAGKPADAAKTAGPGAIRDRDGGKPAGVAKPDTTSPGKPASGPVKFSDGSTLDRAAKPEKAGKPGDKTPGGAVDPPPTGKSPFNQPPPGAGKPAAGSPPAAKDSSSPLPKLTPPPSKPAAGKPAMTKPPASKPPAKDPPKGKDKP